MGELLRRDSLLRVMIGGFLGMNLFFGPLLVFLPLFAKAAYGGNIGTLASLETSLGAGTALGGVFLALFAFKSKADHDVYQDAPAHHQFVAENRDDWGLEEKLLCKNLPAIDLKMNRCRAIIEVNGSSRLF